MKLVTSFDYPPIPTSSFDWSCIDDDTYDVDYDYEAGRYTSNCPHGHGRTEFDAVTSWVEQYLEKLDLDLSVSEMMRREECERCGKLADCEPCLKREEMLSDERGTVWGYVEVPLCYECERYESGPDPDMLYDQWRDRQIEDSHD